MTLTQHNENQEKRAARAMKNMGDIVPMEEGNGYRNVLLRIKNSEGSKYVGAVEYVTYTC